MFRICKNILTLSILLSVVASQVSRAADCTSLSLKVEQLESSTRAKFVGRKQKYTSTHFHRAWTEYEKVREQIPLEMRRGLVHILSDFEQSYFHLEWMNLVKKAEEMGALNEGNFMKVIEDLQSLNLAQVKRLSVDEVSSRLSEWKKGTVKGWKGFLAELNLSETRHLIYGSSVKAFDPESAIGKYISRTGAAFELRTMNSQPNGPHTSLKRLYVNVDKSGFKAFAELFFNSQALFHIHTPMQGTLLIGHNGKAGSYANLSGKMRLPQVGTVMPMILFKSSESARLLNYFEIAARNRGDYYSNHTLTPWEIPGYCSAKGGYTSCTHWIGNIPVGDRRMESYTFPGRVDSHASNSIYTYPDRRAQGDPDAADAAPRVAQLSDPTDPLDPLRARVWKAPGYEQLADVIGLGEANLNGELANPGYVALKLMADAPADRVPVVFVVVPDAKVPLGADWEPYVHAL